MRKCQKNVSNCRCKLNRVPGALVGLLLLIGCGVNPNLLLQSDTASVVRSGNAISKVGMKTLDNNRVEAVSAVGYDGTHLSASVISHGCTHSTDFSIKHEIVDGRCKITLVRDKPDMCRRAPMIAQMVIEWSAPDDCNDLELVIANPVLVTAGDGRMLKRSK